METAVDAVDDHGDAVAELVGQMLAEKAADDRRRQHAIVDPEARRIAFLSFDPQSSLHRRDDVAALTQLAKSRLQAVAQGPDPWRLFGREPHAPELLQSPETRGTVRDVPLVGRRVAKVEKPLSHLFDQGAIDPGEAILVELDRQLLLSFELADRPEFQGHQLARPLSDAMRNVVAVDDQVLAPFVASVDDDMDVGMAGVEMVDRHPVEPGAEILLDLGHQVAREASEIVERDPILGRDDEAETVAIVLATREEGITVGATLARRIELASLAIPRGAVALDVAQMRRRANRPARPPGRSAP